MRISSLRSAVLLSGIILSALLIAAAALSLAYLCAFPEVRDSLSAQPVQSLWFAYRGALPSDSEAPLWALCASLAVGVFAFACSLRGRALFIRTSSTAALFFTVFLLSACFECLRGPMGLLFSTGGFQSGVVLLNRVLLGSRFAGELALLIMGLHALEMKYDRHLVLFGVLLVLSFAIAASLPIDTTSFLSSLLYKLGDEQGAWFIELALGIITASSFVAAGFTRSGRYFALAAAAAALFLGRQIISFTGMPLLVASGVVLMVAGIEVFLRILRKRGPGDVPNQDPPTR
jgi:hypothetical protein